jgi:hypothetical protein
MRFKVFTPVALLAATMVLAACGSEDQHAQSSTAMTSAAAPTAMQATAMQAATRSGTFQGLNDKHVAGTARVVGQQIELSDFSSDAGPDLHLYLTNGSDETAVSAGKELGPVSFNQAAQSFSLSGVDASQYHDVVIHCDKAKAVFGAATLA